MPYVYLLECADGTFYTGATLNIEERVKKHNAGKASKYTRGRLPIKLVYYKSCESYPLALKEEYRIKKLSKIQKKKLIISFI